MSGARAALVLVMAAAAFTSFFRLGLHSLWYDEITGARLADHRSAAEIFEARDMDSHPPATALAEHWSRQAFGLSEWSLRLPAALASVLSIIFICALAAAFGDVRVGCLAGALAAFSPSFVYFARDARPYALAMFFAAAASTFFVLAFRRRRKYLWFPLYAVSTALALYTHYFTTLVVATHLLIGVVGWLPSFRPADARKARRYAVLFLALLVAVAAAGAAAWPVFSKGARDHDRFPGGEMAITPSLITGAFTSVGWDRAAANVLFLVATLAGVIAIWRREGRFAGAAAMALVLLPIFLPVAVIRLTTQYWNPRFCYFAFPAAMAVAAYGFVATAKAVGGKARRDVAAGALAAVLVLGAVRALVDNFTALRVQYETPVQDFRGAVTLVNRNVNWQTKILVWPYRNWDCYHFYTKTQGGPNAQAKPRPAVFKLFETWPRIFVVCTDGEFSQELLERYPRTIRFRLQSMDVLYRDNAYKTDAALFRRLPGDVVGVPPAVMYNALGRYSLSVGKSNRAREYFEEAIEVGGPDAAETFVLAKIYADAGEYEQARRLAGAYVRRYPYEAWPYTRLAAMYEAEGDRNSAIAYYRRALWLDPSKDNWRKRLDDLRASQPFFRAVFGYSDPRWM